MSFSYNENQIVASGTNYISFVRFTVNDTDSNAYDVSDEVITAQYNATSANSTQTLRNYQTAYAIQQHLCNKSAGNIQQFSSGGTSVTYTQEYCSEKLSYLRQMVMLYSGQSSVLYPSRQQGFNW